MAIDTPYERRRNARGRTRTIGYPTGSAAITLPSVIVYPIDHFHLRRGLIGSNASRHWFTFRRRSDNQLIVVDTTHEGSGANAATWNTSASGAIRVAVSLSDGAKTAAEWATAIANALVLAGFSATSSGGTVTINGAASLAVGAAYDETRRGMQGIRRTRFATSGSPSYTPVSPAYTAINETGSVHTPAPATAGRIIGVYLLDTSGTRSGSVRLAVSNGPTYSVASKALTGTAEGLATRGSGNDVYLLKLPEPQAMSAAADKWCSYRTNTAAAVSIADRPHGSSPVGNGDLVANERVLANAVVTDPATPIADGSGNYTQTAASSRTSYVAIGYIFEQPSSGDYYGDASIDSRIGFRNPTYNIGTPTTLTTALVRSSTDTPRFPIPWAGSRLVSCRVACGSNAANEDLGVGVYNMSAATITAYPLDAAAPLLASIRPMDASAGAGYKEYTFPTPIDLTGVTRIGLFGNGGNDDGVTVATTVTVLFDSQSANEWGGGWVDERDWSDNADVGGYGANAQYVTSTPPAGDMPVGDPSPATSPDPFDTDATDTTFRNIPRTSVRVTRAGSVAA